MSRNSSGFAKNEAIEIFTVENGFVVRQRHYRGDVTADKDAVVFQSFAELAEWLSEHFTDRYTQVIKNDFLL